MSDEHARSPDASSADRAGKPSPSAAWTEQDVEKVLTAFFHDEMPAQLRALSDEDSAFARPPERVRLQNSDHHAARPDRAGNRPGRWGILALLASAAAVLVVGVFLRQRPDQPDSLVNEASDQPGTAVVKARDAVDVEDVALDERQAPLPMVSLKVDRYQTEVGVVEQRTHVQWTNVSVYEPDAGVEVAWSVPEIRIEVYGVAE